MKDLSPKRFLILIFISVMLLTTAVANGIDFFNEYSAGGSDPTQQGPSGVPSFPVYREMSPNSMLPVDFSNKFKLQPAQSIGHYGEGETIGFIEGDSEFSQSAFDAFCKKFAHQVPELTPLPKVIVLPKVQNVGKNYKSALVETMLDVEWAHVVAPKARLVIFDSSMSATKIQQYITSYHVNVISESMMNPGVLLNARNPLIPSHLATIESLSMSIPFFASSGDSGRNIAPVSINPNAVVVGGIQIGPKGKIQVWNDEGFGTATGLTFVPHYQPGTLRWRTLPDVVWLAGVPGVVVSLPTGWMTLQGTSLSAPLWAGLWALGDAAHKAHVGKPLPTNANATLYSLYKNHPRDFVKPELGKMPAESAGIGYPNATSVVRDLSTFKNFVPKGTTLRFYRWPFYLFFLEVFVAFGVVLFGRTFKHKRLNGIAMVLSTSVFSAVLMFLLQLITNSSLMDVQWRDFSLCITGVPYVYLLYRLNIRLWREDSSSKLTIERLRMLFLRWKRG